MSCAGEITLFFNFVFYIDSYLPDTLFFILAYLTDLNLRTSLEESNKNTSCDVREMYWFPES